VLFIALTMLYSLHQQIIGVVLSDLSGVIHRRCSAGRYRSVTRHGSSQSPDVGQAREPVEPSGHQAVSSFGSWVTLANPGTDSCYVAFFSPSSLSPITPFIVILCDRHPHLHHPLPPFQLLRLPDHQIRPGRMFPRLRSRSHLTGRSRSV
jgi:hypothetical protein